MQDYDWQPMQPNRARCRSHFGRQLPNPGCGCGFYAVSHLQRLPVAVGAHLPIGAVGSVAMWGRVIEHTAGYRGQLAYPDRIRLVCGRCFVARRDGVPTRIEHSDEGCVVPVCDAHATEGRSGVEGMTPAELEQEVLSAYAVDVLPLETLHRAGFQAGPVPPIGLIPNARAELRQLRRSRSAVAALVSLVAALLIVRALGLFPSTAAVDAPREVAAGAPIAIDQPFPDALDPAPTIERVAPVVRRHHVIPLGLVCANRVGDRAEIVPCGRPAELIGFPWSPAEPKRDVQGRQRVLAEARFLRVLVGPLRSPSDPGWSSCGSPVCAAGIWRDEAKSARVERDPRGGTPRRVLQHREPWQARRRPTRRSRPRRARPRRAVRSADRTLSSRGSSTATPWRSTSGAERSPFA